jgi:septal ring factor EnvC (AmiA/AmiB activator)
MVSEGSTSSLENIGKQITPIMKDLSNQIEETKEQLNSTNDLIQKMNNEDNSIKSEIERTNLLSYIATALSASAIILIASRGKVKKLRE